MFTTPLRRAAAILLILSVLALLPVVYGLNPPASGIPNERLVVERPEKYVGEHVVVSGRVVSLHPTTLSIMDEDEHPIGFTITGTRSEFDRGDVLRVYGVLEADRRVRAVHTISVPRYGRWYAYVVSALAGVGVLARLISTWRVNVEELALEPRRPSLRRERTPQEDEPDA